MKTPRDVSGPRLVKALRALGYVVTRQEGSHIRLTSAAPVGRQSHVTVPNHSSLRVGTVKKILRDVAADHKLSVAQLLRKLDL